jgi:hypothetical protein
MDDEQRTTGGSDAEATNSRLQGGVGAPTGLGQGGPQGNPNGPRDANDPGETRYGRGGPGTGSNAPKHGETKEQGDWTSRQGGDQSKGPGTEPEHDAKENDR